MNKTAIKNFAIWSRVTLIDAVKQKAFEYEITEQGGERSAVSVGGRLLTEAEKKQRAALILQIAQKGYAQVMEEAAYTWFNRFIALRYMEVNNFLPLKIRLFSDENDEFNPEILKEAMNVELDGIDKNTIFDLIEKQDNEKLYKYLLIAQCNALGESLPGMFEKIEDYTELLFPNNLLKPGSVLDKMVTEIPTEDWEDAVQIIGWMYQYYNAELKDDTFAKLKKNIKISKERIPAATQLFTPDWIVRYMVENSLGRIFIADSGKWLADSMTEEERAAKEKEVAESFGWKYYLPEAEQTEEVRKQLIANHSSLTTDFDVSNIKVIDPCMGSGHILVYAFDVLMQIYESEGWSERDAAKSILENNLYGLDIDDRAGQLAYFAVMMKARKYNRRILSGETKPNVMAIQESNSFNSDYLSLFGELKDKALSLLENMKDAKELGSIIQVKLTVEDLSALKEKAEEIKNNYYDNFFDTAKQAGVVTDFIPLINQAIILAQKYDVVVTNPPYMGASGMSAKLGEFVKKNYPDGKSDLFAVFIEKCRTMIKANGYQAMITMHSWMFISSFELLRAKIYQNSIINLIHLGIKAFEEIGNDIVQTCAFIFKYSTVKSYESTFVRLVDCKDFKQKEQEFLQGNFRNTSKCDRLKKIPGNPLAYWVGNQFVENFARGESVERFGVFTGSQNITGDNERFLRFHWEVCNQKINNRWFFYAKGGDYRQYYGNLDLVIDWSDFARSFYSNNKTSNLLNTRFWYKEGITYSAITSRGTGFRYLPEGCLFDKGGPSINIKDHLYEILALFNSNVAKYYFGVFNPSINLQVKDVKNFPIIISDNNSVSKKAELNTVICKDDWNFFETASDFKKHPLV